MKFSLIILAISAATTAADTSNNTATTAVSSSEDTASYDDHHSKDDDYSKDDNNDDHHSKGDSDDDYSFAFVGDGSCAQMGKMYDSVVFTGIDTVALCGSLRYCGNSQVRGFSYSFRNQHCVCHFDHGYDRNTIPPDMISLKGYSGFVVGNSKNNKAVVGTIHESLQTYADIAASTKCYSNNNFQNPYTFIGDGSCTNHKNEMYDFVSYDNVMKMELCGSPVYCGRPQVRGFSYDDMNYCVCFFEDGWDLSTIPADMKEDLPGYNAKGSHFGNTATGAITGSDENSLFRKCYSNHNFTFRTIKSLRGIGLQVRR